MFPENISERKKTLTGKDYASWQTALMPCECPSMNGSKIFERFFWSLNILLCLISYFGTKTVYYSLQNYLLLTKLPINISESRLYSAILSAAKGIFQDFETRLTIVWLYKISYMNMLWSARLSDYKLRLLSPWNFFWILWILPLLHFLGLLEKTLWLP